jgi:16S rRNA (cytosine967-C5)-methyltransferase
VPGGPTRPRVVALEVMRELRRGDLLDRVLERLGGSLPSRDLAWTRELLYGTQRLRGRIDHLLAGRVKAGLEELEPDVLDVLRLGAYQLLEMGGVPTYAAISQSVDLVRLAGSPRAAGLVNGVLRALDRERGQVGAPATRGDAEHLRTWGSHPTWLVERWLDRWGYDETERLVAANNLRPELYIRPVGTGAAEAAERLEGVGVSTEPVSFAPRSLRITSPADVAVILEAVPAVVQDPAAGLVVDYAAVPAGSTVLDLCSAPGGKTVGVAESAAFVVAADLSRGRIGRVGQNVRRVGIAARVALAVADARTPPFAMADVVLLDAPCTGTGTFRRHPDGRWRVGPEELAALVVLQRQLLEAAAALVRPGGLLVYATCSLEPEENGQQVAEFLERHREFAREPQQGTVDRSLLAPDGDLLVLPQRQGVDGSFAARLRRID